MIERLRIIAKKLGASEFGVSQVKNKRFYVVYQGKRINFGSKTGKAYIDHRNFTRMKAWYKRHREIRDKEGKRVINLKTSPSFWSSRLLWPPVSPDIVMRMIGEKKDIR